MIAREDEPGEKRLVAYYTGREGEIGPEELRTHLSGRLPEYMVPAAFVKLERMPLTPNGKVDRKALPAPEGSAFAVQGTIGPQTETEETLAEIFADLLKLERVGRHDNFFELGGHSLLATQMVARGCGKLGWGRRCPYATFSNIRWWPIWRLELEGTTPSRVPSIPRSPRGERIPLSFAQQRLWFLAQMEGASETYHIPVRLRLRGKLNGRALRRALERIVARHEVLRTSFRVVGGEPVQWIAPAEESGFRLLEKLEVEEAGGWERGELEREAAEEAGEAFDLETGPVIRGRLVRLAEEDYALLITMHHIVSDGWSSWRC